MNWTILASVNAALNAISFVLLVLGYRAIKQQRQHTHEHLMKAAGVVTALFLASYVTYHIKVGHVLFNGQGAWRALYFFILITHVFLAVVNAVLASITFWYAHKERWESHKKIARVTFPIWIYVSVTGVVIYVMVYHAF